MGFGDSGCARFLFIRFCVRGCLFFVLVIFVVMVVVFGWFCLEFLMCVNFAVTRV